MAGGPSVPGVGPGSAQQMMNSGNGGHLDKNLELLLDLSAIEIRDEYEEVPLYILTSSPQTNPIFLFLFF